MRVWASDIPDFKESVSKEDLDTDKNQKVLGLTWHLDIDKLQVNFSPNAEKRVITKRVITTR